VISEKYPLDPVPCGGYRQRTLENVQDSDGTAILFNQSLTGGTKLTRDLCIREKKPFVLINAAANGDPCHRDVATTWQMPKGEPESRLWVAVTGRVHDARTARPVGEHPIDARAAEGEKGKHLYKKELSVGAREAFMVSTVFQLAFIVGLPFVVSGSVAYLAWGDLKRPWLYLVVTTGVLYVVYGLTFVFFAESMAVFFSAWRGDSGQLADSGFTGLVLLKFYAKPLLGFSVMALPILAAIYVFFRRSE
jgi:hypothetical protein